MASDDFLKRAFVHICDLSVQLVFFYSFVYISHSANTSNSSPPSCARDPHTLTATPIPLVVTLISPTLFRRG